MKLTMLKHGRVMDDKYINDASGQELDVAWHGGIPRILGCLPPRKDFGGLPKLRSANPSIPESEWREFSLRGFAVPILNQGATGSCVGHAGVEAFWRLWLMQNQPVPAEGFSSCWLYSLINGGYDGGAVISDAMTALMTDGVALLSQVPEGMIFKRQIPDYSVVAQTASLYKASTAYHLESWEDICSALQMRLPVVFAIRAGGSWDVDPSTGIVQFVRGPGNHAQHALGMKKIGGEWCLEVQNSWGTDWGLGGYYYATQRHIENAGQDAFAIQSDAQNPNNTHLPPRAA